jgi:superfamily II RNA helicase
MENNNFKDLFKIMHTNNNNPFNNKKKLVNYFDDLYKKELEILPLYSRCNVLSHRIQYNLNKIVMNESKKIIAITNIKNIGSILFIFSPYQLFFSICAFDVFCNINTFRNCFL